MIKPPKSWKNLSTHYKVVLKNDWYKNLCLFQDEFNYATALFYKERGIQNFQFPLTTNSISSPVGLGSNSSPVKVNIKGIDTYLADSMQFFLEYACRLNKKGAYYLAPSFRGEKANKRHLSQLLHSEAEISGGLDEVISLCQDYLEYLVTHLLKNCANEIEGITNSLAHLENFLKVCHKIPRCTFEEAAKILKDNSNYIKNFGNYRTINSKGEKRLMEYFGGYVWLIKFDYMAVPFYQKYDPADPQKTLNADLLMGIGEIIGSGERHFSGVEVKKALDKHRVSSEPYGWYIYMKEKYPLQTSGFGMGVERFFLWLLKHDDIRDCQLLPRFNGIKTNF